MSEHMSPTEQRIVGRLVDEILSRGYLLSVNDGEEWTVKRSADRAEIMAALATTDSDLLGIRKEGDKLSYGGFSLIWGNGADVIADHSNNELCAALFDKVVG